MNDKKEMLAALRELAFTSDVLIDGLATNDLEKGSEAVTVLLMQGMTHFGSNSVAMQQFFPVWDAIKTHIDRGDGPRAARQARLWKTQLEEVISIVISG